MEEGKRFLSKLPRSGRVLILADNDADGIISAHLFARYYHKRNPYVSMVISIVNREEVPDEIRAHRGYVPILLDISPDTPIVDVLETQCTGRRATSFASPSLLLRRSLKLGFPSLRSHLIPSGLGFGAKPFIVSPMDTFKLFYESVYRLGRDPLYRQLL